MEGASLQKCVVTWSLAWRMNEWFAPSCRKVFPCLYIHSLEWSHYSFSPQHRNLHFAQNLPGAADFYSHGNCHHYRNVCCSAPQTSFNMVRRTWSCWHCGDRTSPTTAHRARVLLLTSVMIPRVLVRKTLWLLKHYSSQHLSTISCPYLSELI